MPIPQSLTDKILAFIATAIVNAATTQGVTVTVERSRRRPSEASELPLITVRPLKEPVEKIGTGIRVAGVRRFLHFAVVVRVVGLDANLDPFRTLVINAVMADLTAGGICSEINELEHDWEADDASDADYSQDVIIFAAEYQTARNTPVSK